MKIPQGLEWTFYATCHACKIVMNLLDHDNRAVDDVVRFLRSSGWSFRADGMLCPYCIENPRKRRSRNRPNLNSRPIKTAERRKRERKSG